MKNNIIDEQNVTVELQAPIVTRGQLNENTKNVWIVCHGYGQLARNFVRRLDVLDSEEDFVLGLQGLSKFYVDNTFGYVGASWMTKVGREIEIENQIAYFKKALNHVFEDRNLEEYTLNLLGFSQGVSTICRMAAAINLQFDNLVLWAGSFPPELGKDDFNYLSQSAKAFAVVGDQDTFIKGDQVNAELKKLQETIDLHAELIRFDGGHEVDTDILKKVISRF